MTFAIWYAVGIAVYLIFWFTFGWRIIERLLAKYER